MEEYCFCKRGKQGWGRGFMISCDSCSKWYHGKCVGIKEKDAPASEDSWYCGSCLKSATQCANPPCTKCSREKSKYCSDDCAMLINQIRYDNFFKPRWQKLAINHSAGRFIRLKELARLEEEIKGAIELIGKLKDEKLVLEANINRIKSEAQELRKNNNSFGEQDDETSMDTDEQGESTGESKIFCIICGSSQPSDKAFKHWASCHKKLESNYNFTSDVPIRPRCAGVDEEANLYCQKQDKKTKRYCMHIESACPQHSNWQIDKDEVCGCPLEIGQELVCDGNYCLELKKDCRLHYNWDKFRLASKNMERIQAFSRLDALNDKMNKTQSSLNDTYGGVIGVMKNTTVDYKSESDNYKDIDVDVTQ